MKKRRIIAGTVLAATVLCWALWGDTAKVDTVPAATTERAVSAPCAPQVEPSKSINNIIIEEPVVESETIPVTGSVASLEQKTPTVIPAPTSAEEPIMEQPAAIPESAPAEEPTMQLTAAAPQATHDGMIYVPGFGWLQSEDPGEWSVSENMYENGNKVGLMG